VKQVIGPMDFLRRDGGVNVYRLLNGDANTADLLLIADPDDPGALRRLKQEFAVTRDLDPSIVIRPREMVSALGRTALLVDDCGTKPLAELLAQPVSIPRLLTRAIGLARALGHVHERGLVHGNVRPDTVWIDPSDRVWLSGLGGAFRTHWDHADFGGDNNLSSPIYISPEQTGRVNHKIDGRSDLYVFGVILYQMFSAGSLPFVADGSSQWIHYHIARKPNPLPASSLETETIEQLVFRLLAKSADDRYQTAGDAERDLRACLAAWQTHGTTSGVRLTAYHTGSSLRMPERLYGREAEINTILSAYHRAASTGATEWVFISGYSGSGKSSLVSEVRKALTPTNGSFISGKFDQYKRNIPFATPAQAFRSLIRQILGQDSEALERWRTTLQTAVGDHGELMVNLMPELTLLIGDQPALPELPPHESRSLFRAVLGRFLSAIARPEHPLVLFLDDLQWMDQATAEFLVRLGDEIETSHLLVICAYRDNEVDGTHPLSQTLERIRRSTSHVEHIRLAPLGLEHIGSLVAEVLRTEPELVASLSALIHRKTAGNPFFAIQFFSALLQEELVSFHALHQQWAWNADQIDAKGFTDNVVDLMTRKLDRFPPSTRLILQTFSCLGMAADARLLAHLCNMSEAEVHDQLYDPVVDELVLRLPDEYRFVHDRVREAAYRLIPPSDLPATHLTIARHLAGKAPASSNALFNLVNHYTLGASLLSSPSETLVVANYNIEAGHAAKKAIAYNAALAYFKTALFLLGDDRWISRPDLVFQVEYELAECEFLTGALTEAEERLEFLGTMAPGDIEVAAVVALQITLFTATDRSERAIETCLAHLRHAGINWSQHPDRQEACAEYALLMKRLGGRGIESLIDLPIMRDRSRSDTVLSAMTAALAPAFFTDLNLVCLLLCRMANISIQHGNCDASALAYAYLGMVVGPCFGDYGAAFRFGDLGLRLVEHRGLTQYRARVHLTYGAHVLPWARPLHEAQPYLRRAFDESNETGDLTYAGFSSCTLITNRLSAGDPLDDVEIEASARLTLMQRAKFGLIVYIITSQLQLIKSLRGQTADFGSLNDEGFEEDKFEQLLSANHSLDIAKCWFLIRKMQARYFAGDYGAALDALLKAEPLLWTTVGHHEFSIYHFYAGMISAANVTDDTPPLLRAEFAQRLVAAHSRMADWELHNPETYKGATALLAAEISRIQDRPFEALQLYQQAISSSRSGKISQVGALAHELAARLYRRHGFETEFQAHLSSARNSYQEWGALGKVEQIDRLHPELAPGLSTVAQGQPSMSDSFDLAAVLKTSEAVSNEAGVPRLMEILMTLVLEQAGAQRGLLILPQGDDLFVRAEAATAEFGIQVALRDDPISENDIPTSIVNLVARTGEAITIDDAHSSRFADDAYVAKHQSRSILCLPLMKRAKLIGIIFLENKLAPSVFTAAKVAVLRLLSSQAAMSLKTALLEEKDALVEALQKSQSELMRMSRLTSIGELVISIAHEINQPLTAIVTNADVCVRWLNNKQPDLDEAKDAARRVVENVRRAADVVQTIRGLAVKSFPAMSPINVDDVIREILSIIQNEIRHHNIHLEITLGEGNAAVLGNKVQLQQVLLNLTMNAIESLATIVGRRMLTVTSEAGENGSLLISISDNGLGFDESRIDQLFEALVTTKPQGMGMGLSISKSIVESHGGKLWARSVRPHGACFQFSLPLYVGQ
jgi:predicted ATPase/signal transduction histidine kinase